MSKRQVKEEGKFPAPLPRRIERMRKGELVGLLDSIYYNIEVRTDSSAVRKIREIFEDA